MLKLLLCFALVAFVAADLRPTTANGGQKIKVGRQEDVYVTDMDRMSYDGLFTLEQTNPHALSDDIPMADVVNILGNSMGENWRDHVDLDDSQPLTYLELVRLSTTISYHNERMAEEDYRRGYSGKKTNWCFCHGTSSELVQDGTITENTGNRNGKPHPFKGVRISGHGQGHIGGKQGPTGHHSYDDGSTHSSPYEVPRDCVLCQGLTNCNNCCNGVCTAGTPTDYANFDFDDTLNHQNFLGLYGCPFGIYSLDGRDVNDISDCDITIETCEDAIGLCDCHQRRHILEVFGCTCLQVMEFCDDCYEAWDAVDRYKHCECEDYAEIYAEEFNTP